MTGCLLASIHTFPDPHSNTLETALKDDDTAQHHHVTDSAPHGGPATDHRGLHRLVLPPEPRDTDRGPAKHQPLWRRPLRQHGRGSTAVYPGSPASRSRERRPGAVSSRPPAVPREASPRPPPATFVFAAFAAFAASAAQVPLARRALRVLQLFLNPGLQRRSKVPRLP